MRATSLVPMAVLGLLAGLAASRPAAAQRPPAARLYDTTTGETVSGTVVRIDTVPARGGVEGGVHLQLRTARDTIPVHLGPAWYLARQSSVRLAAGDRVTVRGSRITVGGGPPSSPRRWRRAARA